MNKKSKSGVEVEQRNLNDSTVSEEERHEAATEAPIGESKSVENSTVNLNLKPQAKVSEETRQKVEQAVIRQRQKLTQIADIALAAEAKTNNANVNLGSKFLENSKALCANRDVVGPGLTERAAGTYYTPGWLADLAKEIAGHDKPLDPTAPEMVAAKNAESAKKPSMDFGRFHVVRFAIPGMTMLSFRRKQEKLECGSLVKGRIIVAEIRKRDVGCDKLVNRFTVKSYEPGEAARVLYAVDSWVSMSKTEKIVYKMVKCDIKETQRRHISRKRSRTALAAKNAESAKEVK